MKRILCIFFLIMITACKKQAFTTCDTSSIYSHTSFPVGVAVDESQLRTNDLYRDIVINQFNSITGENAFKFVNVEPEPYLYSWAATDYIAAFAKQYNKRLHGHCLVWHNQLPGWVFTYQGDFRAMLQDHITQEVGRYKETILSWDVVNEAFNEDGTLRNTIWLDKLGIDYIKMAFEFAHAANPRAKLFYNEYNLEWNTVKLKGVIDFLTQLKLKGVPIDGIGMQMHINNTFPAINNVADAAKKIADAGFLVHFSEMDVSMEGMHSQFVLTGAEQQEQARRYASVFTTYSQVSSQYQFGITLWGVDDGDSWLSQGAPLLFDGNYQAKPAYCASKSIK